MRALTKTSVFILAVAVVAAAIFVIVGTNLVGITGSEAQDAVRVGGDPLETLETGTTDELSNAFFTIANAVQPQVVQVMIERQREAQRRNPFEGTPFEDFFEPPAPQEPLPPSRGLGSGVIVRENGYIATNYHVVAGADEIAVRLARGETYDAEVVGTDPSSDLAVVKIDASDLPVIPYADAQDVAVGNWVLAVGSPFSPLLGNSVTAGIISATGRTGLQGLAPEAQYAAVQDFIQTDAAINPGNSGGALVDLHARLVGINTAIISQTGGNVGIGFAIPIDIVRDVVPELIEEGYVARGFLGVSFRPITPALAEAFDISPGAAQIVQVTEGGPAAEAGLQPGDVIVSIAGQTLRTTAQLGTIVGSMDPGEEVEITYIRDEERRTVTVELESRPEEAQLAQRDGAEEEPPPSPDATALEELGIEIADLTRQRIRALEQQFGARLPEGTTGVVVTGVQPGSMAYGEANLRRGFVITQVAGQDVESVEAFQQIYDEVESGEYFRVTVVQPTQQGGPVTFQTALRKPSG